MAATLPGLTQALDFMKIYRLPIALAIAASLVSISGCFPYKPQTLWFKADPPQQGSPRTFRIEISEMLVGARKDEDHRDYVTHMAEFWSRSEEKLCPYGIVPIDYGYNQDKKRYWMTAQCKPEI